MGRQQGWLAQEWTVTAAANALAFVTPCWPLWRQRPSHRLCTYRRWSIHCIGQSGGGRLAHNTIASQDPDGLQFPVPVPRPLFGRYAGCCPTAWPGDLEVVGGLKGVTVLQAESSSADGEG